MARIRPNQLQYRKLDENDRRELDLVLFQHSPRPHVAPYGRIDEWIATFDDSIVAYAIVARDEKGADGGWVVRRDMPQRVGLWLARRMTKAIGVRSASHLTQPGDAIVDSRYRAGDPFSPPPEARARHRFVVLNGILSTEIVQGHVKEGAPTYLYVHGHGLTADCFRPFLDDHRSHGEPAAAADLPGYGTADPPRFDALGEVTDFVQAYVRHRAWRDGPVVLRAASMSTPGAAALAFEPPPPLQRVQLLGPVAEASKLVRLLSGRRVTSFVSIMAIVLVWSPSSVSPGRSRSRCSTSAGGGWLALSSGCSVAPSPACAGRAPRWRPDGTSPPDCRNTP